MGAQIFLSLQLGQTLGQIFLSLQLGQKGRIIFLDLKYDDKNYILCNIYNPNPEANQVDTLEMLGDFPWEFRNGRQRRLLLEGPLTFSSMKSLMQKVADRL